MPEIFATTMMVFTVGKSTIAFVRDVVAFSLSLSPSFGRRQREDVFVKTRFDLIVFKTFSSSDKKQMHRISLATRPGETAAPPSTLHTSSI